MMNAGRKKCRSANWSPLPWQVGHQPDPLLPQGASFPRTDAPKAKLARSDLLHLLRVAGMLTRQQMMDGAGRRVAEAQAVRLRQALEGQPAGAPDVGQVQIWTSLQLVLHSTHPSVSHNTVFQGIRQYRTGGRGDFRRGPARGVTPLNPAAACLESPTV